MGFAIAITIGCLAIDRTISGVKTPGALTPKKISAPERAPAKVPAASTANSFFSAVKSERVLERMPLESHIKIVLAPAFRSNRAIAIPAAPAPLITIRTSSIDFFTNFRALYKAARLTIAVPC